MHQIDLLNGSITSYGLYVKVYRRLFRDTPEPSKKGPYKTWT
jgi:hypothetical protein